MKSVSCLHIIPFYDTVSRMRSLQTNPALALENQTADVTTEENVNYAAVLEKIKKTGKKVNSGEADGVPQSV